MKQAEKTALLVVMTFVLMAGLAGSATMVSAARGDFGVRVTGEAIAQGVANGHVKGNAEFNDNGRVKNVAQIENEYRINNESNVSIGQHLDDINKMAGANAAASGFAQVSHGTGWAISSDNQGSFAQITLIERSFVNVTNATTGANSTEFSVGNGVLKLTGMNALNLQLASSSGNTFVFNVSGAGDGTLTLTKETSLQGFTVWSGDLEMNSGTSYSIHVATMDSKVIGEGVANGQAHVNVPHGRALGFWARVWNFFGFHNQNQNNASTNTTTNVTTNVTTNDTNSS